MTVTTTPYPVSPRTAAATHRRSDAGILPSGTGDGKAVRDHGFPPAVAGPVHTRANHVVPGKGNLS